MTKRRSFTRYRFVDGRYRIVRPKPAGKKTKKRRR